MGGIAWWTDGSEKLVSRSIAMVDDTVEEFLIHAGYRNNKGSLGVEARLAKAAALPRIAMRLPRDIRYDVVMFVLRIVERFRSKGFEELQKTFRQLPLTGGSVLFT